MHENKKFDFATITVIIVSICLTLGGFYLLNQSFAKSKTSQKNVETITNSSSTPTETTSSILFVEDTPIQSSSATTKLNSKTNSNPISSSSLNSSSISSITPASLSSTTVSTIPLLNISSSLNNSISNSIGSTNSSIINTSNKSNLSKSEAIFKVIESKDNKYTIQILDTGYENGKYWKLESSFKITSNIALSPNQEYTVTNITESGNSVEFGSIKPKP